MVPTIYSFINALVYPKELLTSLCDARTNLTGLPSAVRTSRFAEAQIEWQGARWLLCMPLTTAAIPEIERTASLLKTLRSEWLADYRLLRNEMLYEDSTGARHRADLVLQHLPAGCTFAEALATEQVDTLLLALEALETELARLDISHRNLKAENLRWSNGKLIPIRYHYARTGAGDDTEAFAALRSEILRNAGSQQSANDVTAHYGAPQTGYAATLYGTPGNRFPGHHWVGHTFEQLTLVEDETGYGYADTSNHMVIPAQFRWADDFHEGRAAVETADGMGLIDKQGRYIIPARYEIVEYDAATGRSEVRYEGLWAEFDYEGRQLGEFTKRN